MLLNSQIDGTAVRCRSACSILNRAVRGLTLMSARKWPPPAWWSFLSCPENYGHTPHVCHSQTGSGVEIQPHDV